MADKLTETHYFVTPIYSVQKPEFLDIVKAVSDRHLEASRKRKKGKRYLNVMTASYMADKAIQPFTQYVSQTAWNILAAQGVAMEPLVTYFTEMWTQEHNTMSSMETHVHGRGAQITGFYFLDVPKGGCKLVIHDPRPGKVISSLPEADNKKITMSSHHVVFTPQPGTLILQNAWVPHSFTRNHSKEPVRFVHMNLSVAVNPEYSPSEKKVEVV